MYRSPWVEWRCADPVSDLLRQLSDCLLAQGPAQAGNPNPTPLMIQNPPKHLEHAAKPVVVARYYNIPAEAVEEAAGLLPPRLSCALSSGHPGRPLRVLGWDSRRYLHRGSDRKFSCTTLLNFPA